MYANTKNQPRVTRIERGTAGERESKTKETVGMSSRSSAFRRVAWFGLYRLLPDEQELVPTETPANYLEAPSENYGSGEHTTVAAFLPWRGL
jgi:hypothetical protein